MRRAPARLVSLAAACAVWLVPFAPAAAEPAAHGTGLPSGLGAGAVALADATRGPFGNPALLLATPRLEALGWLGADASGVPLQRLSLSLPHTSRGAFAAGWTHLAPGSESAERQEWGLAAATRLRAVAAGVTLKLRDESFGEVSEPSFGLDCGVHVTPVGRTGGRTVVEAGAWLQNAVRPQQLETDTPSLEVPGASLDARSALAAIAATQQLGRDWWGTTTLGLETATGSSGALWLGARMAWRQLARVAVSGRSHAWRAGIDVRVQSLGIEYGVARDASDAAVHSLALRYGFGASPLERQTAAAQNTENEVSERLARELAARQARAITAGLAAGENALDHHDFDHAAEGFRNVLLWDPEHAAARAGLRSAQLGAMLQQADSLVARHDYWSASSQLEHAVRLFPEDSLATLRLQEVRSVVDRADRSRSEAAEQFRLGLDAFAAQHYRAAIRCFEAALKQDANNTVAAEFAARSRQALDNQVQTALQQARGRLERRDAEGARSALLSALDAAPGHPEATRLLAQIDRDLEQRATDRRVAEARAEARRQEEAAHEDRAPSAASLPALASTYQRGMANYRAGDLIAAMRDWEEVARRAPHFEEVDQYLLRVYRVVGLESYTEGRLQDAIDIWNKALQLEPENPQVRRYMDQANAKLQRSRGTR
jgi:tetratricopeptide (TPR) repeat protein